MSDNYTLESMKFKDGEAPNDSFGTQEESNPPKETGDSSGENPAEQIESESAATIAADEKAKLDAEANNGDDASNNNDNGDEGKEDAGKAESGSASTEAQTGTETPKEFNQLLGEQSGGNFNSMDEVTAEIKRLTENQRTDKDVLDTDLGEKFKAFREGRPGDADSIFKQFLNTQVQDFKEMDGDAILRYKMAMDNPSMSESDIAFLVDKNYKSDEENDSTDEIRLGKLNKEQDVTRTRKELLEIQSNSALAPSTQEAQNGPTEAELKEQHDTWTQSISDSMTDFKSVDIVIDDKGGKFTFGIDDNKQISEAMADPKNFFNKRHVDKEGNVNMESYRNEIARIINSDKIAIALSVNAVSLANEAHLAGRSNPSTKDSGGNGDGAPEVKSGDAGLADAMKATF